MAPPLFSYPPQGTLMATIALRFDFEKEARKALARAAPSDGALAGANASDGLAEPLLMQGQQCESLEQGQLLAQPAVPLAHSQLEPAGPS